MRTTPNSTACACGCGEVTDVATSTDRHAGRIRGQHFKYRPGHYQNPPTKPKPYSGDLVPCGCGCGELMAPFGRRGRPRQFLPHHGGRIQPHDKREWITCLNCGKQSKRAQWWLKDTRRTFCNQACAGEYASKTGERRGANNGHYNSVTLSCFTCGSEVTKPVSTAYRSWRVFCPDCSSKDAQWRGGGYFYRNYYQGYAVTFDNNLRRKIRRRDGYTCQLCGRKPDQTPHVHHIDYNKQNSSEANLITLCASCHSRTNRDCPLWVQRLTELQISRGIA